MDTHKKMRVHLSTLVDEELPVADLELAMAALQTPDGQQTWDAYHRIGDELRAAATPALSDGFAATLAARLDAEPAPLRRNSQRNADGMGSRRTVARASASGRRSASNPAAAGAANAKREAVPAVASEELSSDGKAVVAPKPAIASVS